MLVNLLAYCCSIRLLLIKYSGPTQEERADSLFVNLVYFIKFVNSEESGQARCYLQTSLIALRADF